MGTARNLPQTDSAQEAKSIEEFIETPFVKKLIRDWTQRLCRSKFFTKEDREDLQQEFNLALAIAGQSFDHQISHFNSFATVVVSHHARTLLKQRKRRQPSDVTEVSIHDNRGASEGQADLTSQVTNESLQKRVQSYPRDAPVAWAMSEDMQSVIHLLPRELARVARALMKYPVGQAAEQLGISRTTLYRRIDELREHLRSESLNEYL